MTSSLLPSTLWMGLLEGKSEYPEENLSGQGDNKQQTQPTYDAGSGNRTRATLVGGEHSHHCATPAPRIDDSSCDGNRAYCY